MRCLTLLAQYSLSLTSIRGRGREREMDETKQNSQTITQSQFSCSLEGWDNSLTSSYIRRPENRQKIKRKHSRRSRLFVVNFFRSVLFIFGLVFRFDTGVKKIVSVSTHWASNVFVDSF